MHGLSHGAWDDNRFIMPDHSSGIDVLRWLTKTKILWELGQIDTSQWYSNQLVMDAVNQNFWQKLGIEVLGLLGINPRKFLTNFVIEYGSSNTLAWVREDLKIMKAVGVLPGALGVITLSKSGGPLKETLAFWAESIPLLGKIDSMRATQILYELFDPADLNKPAAWVCPPAWQILEDAFLVFGLNKTLVIAHECFEIVRNHNGTWADLVATLRYVVAQVLNHWLSEPVALNIISVEELFCCSDLNTMKGEDYVKLLKQIMNPHFRDRPVRAFNYYCPNCKEWHYIDSEGQSLWFKESKGGPVKKRCRLRFQERTIGELLQLGVGLSGAGIYLSEGLLGKTGQHVFLARNYSRGNVFRVLQPFFDDPKNGAFALPVGAFYFYGEGCNPKVSLDSLIFLEILLRQSNPKGSLAQIMESLPVPYTNRKATVSIEISLDGKLRIR